MAIQKDIISDSGVTTSYHVLSIFLDKCANQINARLDSYIDEAARSTGKSPVLIGQPFYVPPEVWQPVYSTGGNVASAIYDYVIGLTDEVHFAYKFAGGLSV
jgi:hypothetical protein